MKIKEAQVRLKNITEINDNLAKLIAYAKVHETEMEDIAETQSMNRSIEPLLIDVLQELKKVENRISAAIDYCEISDQSVI